MGNNLNKTSGRVTGKRSMPCAHFSLNTHKD